MWSVRILSGPQTGQIFDLKLGKNIFGRSATCDIKILSVGISKEHCEIHVYKDKAMIVDLKSSNGTFVNGVKIQHSIIKLGDKFSLFDVIMDVTPLAEKKVKPAPIQRNINQLSVVPQQRQQHSPQTGFPQMQNQFGANQNLQQNINSSDIQSPAETVLSFKDNNVTIKISINIKPSNTCLNGKIEAVL